MLNFFKNKTLFFIIFFLLNLSFVGFVSAGNLSDSFNSNRIKDSANKMGFNANDSRQVEDIVGTVIYSVLTLLGVIFIVLIIYGGFLWMTAGGNDQEVTKAKKIIKNAAIGLVVIVLSYSLSWLILNVFVKTEATIPTT